MLPRFMKESLILEVSVNDLRLCFVLWARILDVPRTQLILYANSPRPVTRFVRWYEGIILCDYMTLCNNLSDGYMPHCSITYVPFTTLNDSLLYVQAPQSRHYNACNTPPAQSVVSVSGHCTSKECLLVDSQTVIYFFPAQNYITRPESSLVSPFSFV
ncbi:hypothetical protein K474DRAFT_334051 [Panus rudis PR-1116 ss-1]|nr:hypothetical protein K474DRAFT_334051 [Panus rudis PR-1116 ss-1]